MPEQIPEVDVVIAGAGPAGAAAAITLRALGRSVHLVDAASRPPAARRVACGETLVAGALLLLEQLGVKDAFLAGLPTACHIHWSAWGSADAHERATITNPYGPGWFLDRPHFDSLLRTRALQLGAQGTSPGRLTILGRDPQAQSGTAGARGVWDLRIARADTRLPTTHGGHLRARFVIDATGRAARVARALGATRHDADTLAAVLVECVGAAHEGATTHVETCELGWWYASTGVQGRACIALMTDADLLRSRHLAELQTFRALFARTMASRRFTLGGLSPRCPAPLVRSAATGCSLPCVGEGWATVGDAAVSLDPLSSRGISAALLSGTHAAHAIHAHLNGEGGALAAYAATMQRVYAEHLRTQRAYYQMEQRFAQAPFWHRRQLATEPLAMASA